MGGSVTAWSRTGECVCACACACACACVCVCVRVMGLVETAGDGRGSSARPKFPRGAIARGPRAAAAAPGAASREDKSPSMRTEKGTKKQSV